MSDMSTQQLREELIMIFEPVKDKFSEYKKVYMILTTYKVVPKVWLESLYTKTKEFWLEQYHHYVNYVHDSVYDRIKQINEVESAQAEDADVFLDNFLSNNDW